MCVATNNDPGKRSTQPEHKQGGHPAQLPHEKGGHYPEDWVKWEGRPRMPIFMESVEDGLLDGLLDAFRMVSQSHSPITLLV